MMLINLSIYICHCYLAQDMCEKPLTNSSCLALANWLHDADDTARLERGLEPVGGVVYIGHIDPQAAIFAQEDHSGPLLLIAGCVTDSHHVLNLQRQAMHVKERTWQLLLEETNSLH